MESSINKFLQCFCAPDSFSMIVVFSAIALLFLLYWISLWVFRRFFSKESFIRKLAKALKWPLFFLIVEISLIFLTHLFLQGNVETITKHILNILVIGTIAWLLAAVAKRLFHYFLDPLMSESEKNLEARTLLTQLIFLYRLTMLLIVGVGFAAVLMTFPHIRTLGIGILGSAGILGIALGIAARPILLNVIAGFQIAMTEMVKIGDGIFLNGELCKVESLHLTHAIARTWDLRRMIIPISYFIDNTFQNWDSTDRELIASILLYCDFRMPIDPIRKKVEELLYQTPYWNKKAFSVYVTNSNEQSIEVRIAMSASDSNDAFELRCYMREKLLQFLKDEYPDMLPCVRYRDYPKENLKLS